VAERQDEGDASHHHHQPEGGAVADQVVDDERAVGGGVEHEDAGADQRLGDAAIDRPAGTAAGEFAEAEQDESEQRCQAHLHRRRDQADLDRIADEEDAARREGDAADPDQQPAADPALEESAERLPFVGIGPVAVPLGRGCGLWPCLLQDRRRRRRGRRRTDDHRRAAPSLEQRVGVRREGGGPAVLETGLEMPDPRRQHQREDEQPGEAEEKDRFHRPRG
jgi:hypothetical protein